MHALATALEDAGGTAAPRERSSQLRALLLDDLARSERELGLPRSGREQPVSVVFAAAAGMLLAVVPVAAAVRADADAAGERAWLVAAAAVGALVELPGRRCPAVRRTCCCRPGRWTDTSRCGCRQRRRRTPISPRSPSRSTSPASRACARWRSRCPPTCSPTRSTGAPRWPCRCASPRRSRGSAATPPTPRRSPSTRRRCWRCSRSATAAPRARTTTRSRRGGSRGGSSSASTAWASGAATTPTTAISRAASPATSVRSPTRSARRCWRPAC